MFPGFVWLLHALQRAGKTKLSRGVEWIQFQSALEGGNRLFLLVQLRLHQADEIKDISILRGKSGSGLKSLQRFLWVCLVLVYESQRIPGMSVVGISLQRRVEDLRRLIVFLKILERDTLIDLRYLQFWIEGCSLPK